MSSNSPRPSCLSGNLIKHSSASAVKIEGAEPEVLKVIHRLIRMGIPVMGHLGLTPQSVKSLGFRRQAEDEASQEKLLIQASQIEDIGCFSLVLEHVPSSIAEEITNQLNIPVIGIGAGNKCDGQVRVTADLLGLTDKQPPFAQPLINLKNMSIEILRDWIEKNKN